MAPTALLSVSDKSDILFLAEALCSHGYTILSSGGTASALNMAGLPVTKISEYTGFPEILSGRVKTLHPLIHGGILAQRNEPIHQAELDRHGISAIDVVVSNLYPFLKTVANKLVSWEEGIENIDIGGPSMVRAAAKNHSSVTVLTNPSQYETFVTALDNDALDLKLRQHLALEAFEHTSRYDAAIKRWMVSRMDQKVSQAIQPNSSPNFLLTLPLHQDLRYGENPHQKASWYGIPSTGLGAINQIQGKELSTNNLLDLDAALAIVREFGYSCKGSLNISRPAAVVVKHANPCGVATGISSLEALTRALNADRRSAFGGILAVNTTVEATSAKELASLFLECVIAPGFTQQALEELSKKKNLRLLTLTSESLHKANHRQIRSLLGGILVQDFDNKPIDTNNWSIVTERFPTDKEMVDLAFAWSLVRHVHSNGIVIAHGQQSLGIGAGQMNRVGAANIALETAGKSAHGAVLASDGFFPFDDTVRLAAAHGISSIIHPGGSIRDGDSIQACDELGLAMIITKQRHFLH
uniref:Phosphoribosylaminoimidazolecarboxamide formyltransferase/IMP cyclohydrolase n=1 Tax=Paulinella chromatophora TaxID=39717 RepID=B1X4S6_PAUCH|nr:phosphoribosylaminoimidazolecarboxamide formyltransferase/IMP cyclohydrolase [Paulinella chromatophora]ACB42945.1 phosphoribosylaminoimidazolecarboxamide formyltransferase/IMP cyclohydrolase [Paulinella chromatophora]